jgi:N-dimethylarginine dimethylaminohydrolase
VLRPSGTPRVRASLREFGMDVTELDVREVRKTGGGLKGLVLPLERA